MSTEAETIAASALKSAAPASVKTADGREFLITPEGAAIRKSATNIR
jgi:hypothetical protein